ncbi:uncharacterized protein [Misgurnus anguillicaudatus]|uniref:uncharacterized protein isoform X2 n=1 Tax=Misgurnus anguillicaudatus TaxID=75329 RepID=UPI003CCF88B1
MSVNDFCRCCKKNLRIHGVLSKSILIFERNFKGERIYEQVLRLGLQLHKTAQKSLRICRSCHNLITRLERDVPVLNKWKDDEGDQAEEASSSQASEKRDREPTPSKTPRALKKFCSTPSTSTSTKPRRSITEVVTHYQSQTVGKVCHPEDASIVNSIKNKKWTTAAKLILKHKHLVEEIKVHILKLISNECKQICDPTNGFILWKSSPADLKAFSFSSLEADLKCFSPFFFSVLTTATNHSQTATCAAASIALRGREARLSAFAYYLNSILHYGGAKKAVFERLSKMGITTTHKNSEEKQKELALLCGDSIKMLKVQNEVFLNSEAEGNIDVGQRVVTTEDQSTRDPKGPLNTVHKSMEELPLSADEMAPSIDDSEIAMLPFSSLKEQYVGLWPKLVLQ